MTSRERPFHRIRLFLAGSVIVLAYLALSSPIAAADLPPAVAGNWYYRANFDGTYTICVVPGDGANEAQLRSMFGPPSSTETAADGSNSLCWDLGVPDFAVAVQRIEELRKYSYALPQDAASFYIAYGGASVNTSDGTASGAVQTAMPLPGFVLSVVGSSTTCGSGACVLSANPGTPNSYNTFDLYTPDGILVYEGGYYTSTYSTCD